MLGVLGLKIREEFGFSDEQMAWLLAAAILAGALPRLNFGIWADRFGGRTMTLVLLFACALPAYLSSASRRPTPSSSPVPSCSA